jgi:4-amino-4-deoxy-L-arabinose transferase-like glycosyltransferase
MDNHGGPVYFYLIALCIGFFPWCIFLSPSCIDLVARFKDASRARPADRLCLAWIAVWIGFFTLATTKFPHYILPAYPALALLTACFLDQWISRPEIYGTIARRAAWVTVALSGIAVAIIVPFVAQEFLPGETRLAILGAPLVLGAAVCAWFCERRRQIEHALMSLAVTTGGFALLILVGAGVVVDRYQNTALLADAIRKQDAAPDVRIATLQYFRPGLVYYSNRQITPFLDARLAVDFVSAAPDKSYLITTQTDYDQISRELPGQFAILDRTPWFLRLDKTLVVVGPPPTAEIARSTDLTSGR